jgi:folate-binding protein YgfZ
MNLRLPLGRFDVVSFAGPDAVRFLNGQLTQDVRKVIDGKSAAFSCVTDAKGRLQFRVSITADSNGAILVAVPEGLGDSLEARLTRYLIADDVETSITPAAIEIHHFIGAAPPQPAEIIARNIERFGEPGCDWWVPSEHSVEEPDGFETFEDEAQETFRITRGIPGWGKEITEGMLPPEARLESSDISYQKGCYIGQEVISRIKSAGKVNRMLTRFEIDGPAAQPGPITGADGKEVGVVTSIAPTQPQLAIGFLKRNALTDQLNIGGAAIRIL